VNLENKMLLIYPHIHVDLIKLFVIGNE